LRPIASVIAPAPTSSPSTHGAAINESAPVESAPSAPEPVAAAVGATTGGLSLSLEEVRDRFATRVVPRTSRAAQLLLRSARIESLDGLLLTIAVPSEEMRQNTELIAQGLKGALEHEFKVVLTLQWTVNPSLVAEPVPARRATKPITDEPDHAFEADVDVSVVVDSAANHLITEMFPGAEEIS
jgi:hypothetical protein